MAGVDAAGHKAARRLLDALTYEAPFLIEKLVKDRIVETPEEGEELFTEVKRWIALIRTDRTRDWEMYSARIDEVWHQFILFTREYIEFCNRFFGAYVSHFPSNAPETDFTSHADAVTLEEFGERYKAMFGECLPDVWSDHKSVTTRRRILNRSAGALAVR